MSDRYIYFIQPLTGGPIKIGSALNVAQRIKELQTGSAAPLCLLASITGTVKEERALHRQLKEYRLSGEWFSPGEEVLAAVQAAKDGREISEIILKDDRPSWAPRTGDEAVLSKTFIAAIRAGYGQKRGWRHRVAQDANVSTECVKSWMKGRSLPQCAALVSLGRGCPEIREWTLTMMGSAPSKEKPRDAQASRALQPSLLLDAA